MVRASTWLRGTLPVLWPAVSEVVMTKDVVDDLRHIAEVAPMSAGTRTRLREIALRLELAQSAAQPAQHYHQNCATCTCREPV